VFLSCSRRHPNSIHNHQRSDCGERTPFDAFGFFEQEEENLAVLRELARVLESGARVALKVANAEPLLEQFRASDREQRGDTTVAMERTLLAGPPRLVEDLTITGPHGTERYQRRQRLYQLDELTSAMATAGLGAIAVLAAVTGTPFDPAGSPTMVIIGERRMDDTAAEIVARFA
jgi:hypothetical protein